MNLNFKNNNKNININNIHVFFPKVCIVYVLILITHLSFVFYLQKICSFNIIYMKIFIFSPDNLEWISPAMKLPEETDQMTVTFNPTDMDEVGIIYFKDPDTASIMSFTASRISIKRISGPKQIFFDFVGINKYFSFERKRGELIICLKIIKFIEPIS